MVYIEGVENAVPPIPDGEYQATSVTATKFSVIGPLGSIWQPALTTNGSGGTVSRMDWSDNPALALLDYLKGIHIRDVRIGGCGVPLDSIDMDSFIAAANVCDELVDLKAGGTESRYTCNGFVNSLEEKIRVVQDILQSMAGVLVIKNGILSLYAGAATTATITLTDDDLAGEITVNPSRSIQDKHNTINATCYDKLANDQQQIVPTLTDADYIAEDGGLTLETDITYRFVDSQATAQRLNKIFLGTEREQLSIDATWKPKARALAQWSTFYWTSVTCGYTRQKFRVLEKNVTTDGKVRIIAREENDDKYEWDEVTEEQDPPADGT